MSYKIIITDNFEKDFKHLNKKYVSVLSDIMELKSELIKNPFLGESLGRNCYKIRMAISSKNKGKSGGARVITFVKIVAEKIYLIAIYDKSEFENINEEELNSRLKYIEDF